MNGLSPILSPLVAATDYINRYRVTPEQTDITPYSNIWGIPVWSPLLLLDNPQVVGAIAGQIQYSNQPPPTLLRIDTCIVRIEQTKHIVKTSIQGRPGTIKEYIALGDFIVNVQGMITTPYLNVYPKDDVAKLWDWLTRPNTVEMTSDFLSIIGIKDFVVEDFEIPQIEGSRNQQPFSFRASTDLVPDDIIQYKSTLNA